MPKKMILKLRNKRFLMRVLATMALCIYLPFIIIQMIMVSQSTMTMTNVNEEHIFSMMLENYNAFYDEAAQLAESAMKVSQDALIRNMMREDVSPYDSYQAALALKTYDRSLAQGRNLGVYIRTTDKVIHNGYIKNLSLFCETILGTTGSDDDPFADAFKTSSEMGIYANITDDHGVEKILVMRPVLILSRWEHDAVVFCTIDHDTFRDKFENTIPGCTGIALWDEKNGFLVESDVFRDLESAPGFWAYMEDTTRSIDTELLPNTKLFKISDAAGKPLFLAAVQRDVLELSIQQHTKNVKLTLCISALVTCILLFASMYIIYTPIQNVVHRHQGKSKRKDLSELEMIDEMLMDADVKIYHQASLLDELIVSKLLSGEQVSALKQDGVFPANDFVEGVVLCAKCRPFIMGEYQTIRERLSGCIDGKVIVTSITYQPEIIIVVLSHHAIQMPRLVESAQRVLRETAKEPCTLACGTVIHSLSQLRSSYLSALSSRDAESGIVTFDPHVSEVLQEVSESIKALNIGKAKQGMKELHTYYEQTKRGNQYRRYYLYRIMIEFIQALNFLKAEESEIYSLLYFANADELFAKMDRLLDKAYTQYQVSRETKDHQMRQKMLDYVNANIHAKDLCLTTVANHVQTTIYVVSRQFKEATGMGFKEYVNNARLRDALELLVTTDLLISQVADAVGFENVNSFCSIFKTKYGITPTKAREQHRSKGDGTAR